MRDITPAFIFLINLLLFYPHCEAAVGIVFAAPKFAVLAHALDEVSLAARAYPVIQSLLRLFHILDMLSLGYPILLSVLVDFVVHLIARGGAQFYFRMQLKEVGDCKRSIYAAAVYFGYISVHEYYDIIYSSQRIAKYLLDGCDMYRVLLDGRVELHIRLLVVVDMRPYRLLVRAVYFARIVLSLYHVYAAGGEEDMVYLYGRLCIVVVQYDIVDELVAAQHIVLEQSGGGLVALFTFSAVRAEIYPQQGKQAYQDKDAYYRAYYYI